MFCVLNWQRCGTWSFHTYRFEETPRWFHIVRFSATCFVGMIRCLNHFIPTYHVAEKRKALNASAQYAHKHWFLQHRMVVIFICAFELLPYICMACVDLAQGVLWCSLLVCIYVHRPAVQSRKSSLWDTTDDVWILFLCSLYLSFRDCLFSIFFPLRVFFYNGRHFFLIALMCTVAIKSRFVSFIFNVRVRAAFYERSNDTTVRGARTRFRHQFGSLKPSKLCLHMARNLWLVFSKVRYFEENWATKTYFTHKNEYRECK